MEGLARPRSPHSIPCVGPAEPISFAKQNCQRVSFCLQMHHFRPSAQTFLFLCARLRACELEFFISVILQFPASLCVSMFAFSLYNFFLRRQLLLAWILMVGSEFEVFWFLFSFKEKLEEKGVSVAVFVFLFAVFSLRACSVMS